MRQIFFRDKTNDNLSNKYVYLTRNIFFQKINIVSFHVYHDKLQKTETFIGKIELIYAYT